MKKMLSLITMVLVCAVLFAGCRASKTTETSNVDQDKTPLDTIASNADPSEPTLGNTEPNGDVSMDSFLNISWTRNAEHDTETIRFAEDGGFSYYCGCGNPVNDSDLCEGYTYDEATKTITLDCVETTEEMVTVIKVVQCDENSLHLDFDGEIRIFEK